jgi:hypothetical protein
MTKICRGTSGFQPLGAAHGAKCETQRARRISIMNPRFAARQDSAASRTSSAAGSVAGARSFVRVDAAANDNTVKSRFENFNDPLWGLAVATGIFFALIAAFVASG